MNKKENTLIILGIIFISFNLRAPITSVGPIIEMIRAEYALSGSAAGLITTLPLIAFGLFSPFVATLSQKFGYGKTLASGLILIIAGELIRSYTNIIGLFIGTAIIGIGISIGNVLLPSIIKMKFPHKIGLMTSIYVSIIGIFAAIGAGASIPLAKNLNLGWKNMLASWFFVAIITLLVWLPQVKQEKKSLPTTNSVQSKSTSIWKSTTAWWVALFMGSQSFLFYSLVAWLPTIIVSKGMSESFSGTMALILHLATIPGSLIMPILCDKCKNQRKLVIAPCFLCFLGVITFLFGQSPTTILLAVPMMALGTGGSLSLSIAFFSLRTPNANRTSELSGMSQSAGYLLAAVGPILLGILYDIVGTWTAPIAVLCVVVGFLALFGYLAGNDVTIKE